MAADGTLPVHIRVLIEGAEETGSDDVGEWVRADERGADAVIVFDSGMIDADTPALTLATRGMVFAHLEIRTGTQPAHSGMYGGAALNAFHALHRVLSAVLPGPDGRLPEPLRAGVIAPSDAELESWKTLPGGDGELAQVGARPADAKARRGVLHPHDRRAVAGRPQGRRRAGAHDRGAGGLRRPVGADRRRAALGGDRRAISRRLLRDALPDGRRAALQRRPRRGLRVRSRDARAAGGPAGAWRGRRQGRDAVPHRRDAPILAAFAERGIPAIVSGFSLPDDALHAPNESYRLVALEQGEQAARALYEELAGLQVTRARRTSSSCSTVCGRCRNRSAGPLRCSPTRHFQRVVDLFAEQDEDALLVSAGAKDGLVAAAALEALRRRPSSPDTIGRRCSSTSSGCAGSARSSSCGRWTRTPATRS